MDYERSFAAYYPRVFFRVVAEPAMKPRSRSLIGPLLLALSLTASLGAACGDSSSSPPTATPDTPRLTGSQVSSVVRQYMLAAVSAHTVVPTTTCNADTAHYQGRGIWTCGKYTFDEMTSTVLPGR